ncbi:MAG: phosphatase PAP2 family protein [Candidatus Omnitrophica bacterium]|nr:phosphatase PAP2 family protein [Candidatus Omnitrophota bacterium]
MNNLADLVFIFGAKYLYLLVIVIAFAWFLIQPKPRKKEILIIAGICLPLVFVISKIVGYLYYNPRPFVVGHFKPLIYHSADNGFPSHHELLVSAIAAMIFIFSRRIGLVLWILALLVGFSRVYAGVHHLIDIAGSILISIGSVTLVYFFRKSRGRFCFIYKKQNRPLDSKEK